MAREGAASVGALKMQTASTDNGGFLISKRRIPLDTAYSAQMRSHSIRMPILGVSQRIFARLAMMSRLELREDHDGGEGESVYQEEHEGGAQEAGRAPGEAKDQTVERELHVHQRLRNGVRGGFRDA